MTARAAIVRPPTPSISGRAAIIAIVPRAPIRKGIARKATVRMVIVPRAIVRKAAVTAPARMPNAPTRRVRKVTGRRSAARAAMAAATAMAVVAASAAAVAAALPEGSA